MKLKSIARGMVVAGMVMLALNYISYIMGKPFISIAMLPIGIMLLVIGAGLYKHARKRI